MSSSTLLFEFAYNVLPWATYTIFSVGMIVQVTKWLGGTPSPTVERKKYPLMEKLKALILDFLLQRRMLKERINSLALWAIGWLAFHLPLAFILFGHMRGFGVWSLEWFTWLAPKEFLKDTLPFMTGLAVLGGSLLLLIRRLLLKTPRSISTLDSYAVLLLVISVIGAGNIMRFLPHSPEPLSFTIPPGLTMSLEYTPSLDWLAIHGIIAQIIVIYLPFSGLIHIIGVLITTLGRMRIS